MIWSRMIAVVACALGLASLHAAEFVKAPELKANPNPAVPLAAVLTFTASAPVETTISVSDGEHEWDLRYSDAKEPSKGLPVIGMRPEREHSITVSIRDDAGKVTTLPDELKFKAPPLPTEIAKFPPVNVLVSKPSEREPGFTIVSMRRGQFGARNRQGAGGQQRQPTAGNPFGIRFGMLLGLDREGDVVWHYTTDTRISDFDRMKNGNIVYLTADHRAREIDMLGNIVRTWVAAKHPDGAKEGIPVDTACFHHEIDETPWGNLIILGCDPREVKDYYTSEEDINSPRKTQQVMGDDIVEIEPDTGKVVWRWQSHHHLDPFRIGYETFTRYWITRGFPETRDWSHGNAIEYVEKDDSYLISLRFLDAIFKVDRKSGEIKWILGEPSGYSPELEAKSLTATAPLIWPWHQHAVTLTPEGNVLLYNNSNYMARPFRKPIRRNKTFSRAVEYAVDDENMTVTQVWESEKWADDNVVSIATGDADWLPETGNVLVFTGGSQIRKSIPDDPAPQAAVAFRNIQRWSRVREVRHTDPPEVVFEVVFTTEGARSRVNWGMFGGIHTKSLGEIQ